MVVTKRQLRALKNRLGFSDEQTIIIDDISLTDYQKKIVDVILDDADLTARALKAGSGVIIDEDIQEAEEIWNEAVRILEGQTKEVKESSSS